MKRPYDDAPLFSLFWENSKLSPRTAERFAERLDEDARTAGQVAQLFYPDAEVALERPDDALQHVLARRRSGRAFSPRPLTLRQLGSLLGGFQQREGGRLIASAGGKYPVEVFAFLYRVEGAVGGHAVYYNGDTHALSRLGPVPEWSAAAPAFGLQLLASAPAALFVLAGFPGRVCARYGERGGRFLLMECGYHAHALALRAAHERLAGVETGGLHDDTIKRWLGLDGTDALIALGYACGAPPG